MKKIIIFITLLIFFSVLPDKISAGAELAGKLTGKILLQVEEKGEAWYLNPPDLRRYYLGSPLNAFAVLRELGIGITEKNIKKIPIAVMDNNGTDNDNDGLTNELENAIGTNPNSSDSDNDGYNDKVEVTNNYNPLGKEKIDIDLNYAKANVGKIFLEVEKNGEAWYLSPADLKRYYLGKPDDAFNIMKKLGLGITNFNLSQIPMGYFKNNYNYSTSSPNDGESFYAAAAAIKTHNIDKSLSYFIPEIKNSIKYTLKFINSEGQEFLANTMLGAKLKSSTADEKTYAVKVYYAGYEKEIYFYVKKQPDGQWLLMNL